MTKRLLLGSGGLRTKARFEAWKTEVHDFLGGINNVLFIPYALATHDEYAQRMQDTDFHHGRALRSIHTFASTQKAVENADAISVGGGNTFRLLAEIERQGLLALIRDKVNSGTPYIGISAGTNLACPTIKTTNDMPIVSPSSLMALNLVSFQINPHFFPGSIYYFDQDGNLEPYAGETREDRIREFHDMNQVPVLGLFEGATLRVEQSKCVLKGANRARLFRKGQPPCDFDIGQTLEDLC